MLTKFYWDSCAWIGLLNGEPDKKCELETIYNRARHGSCEIWTSTFPLVEVHKVSDEMGHSKPLDSANLKKIQKMFNQPFVKLIQLDREVAELARLLVRETVGLKKHQDSIHLASAIIWSIPVMHTYDRADLLHLSDSLKCKSGEKLHICFPDESPNGPLFANTPST